MTAVRVLLSTLLAALAAPWASLAAVVVHVAIAELAFVQGPTNIWINVELFVPFALPIAYAVTWTVGIPAHFVLWYAGKAGVSSYAGAGIVLGALASVVVFGLDVLADWRAIAYFVSFFMFVGVAVAVTFRAVFMFFLEPERTAR